MPSQDFASVWSGDGNCVGHLVGDRVGGFFSITTPEHPAQTASAVVGKVNICAALDYTQIYLLSRSFCLSESVAPLLNNGCLSGDVLRGELNGEPDPSSVFNYGGLHSLLLASEKHFPDS